MVERLAYSDLLGDLFYLLWLLQLSENIPVFHFCLFPVFHPPQMNIFKEIINPNYILNLLGIVYEIQYIEIELLVLLKYIGEGTILVTH